MNYPTHQYRRLKQIDRAKVKELGSTSSTRERHGLLRCGAFAAARSRNPSTQKCSELKPPEHLGTANIQPFRRFPLGPPFSFFPPQIPPAVCSICHTRHADTPLASVNGEAAICPPSDVKRT